MEKLDFEHEATVFYNEMNELVERLVLDVKGQDVQILRFNGNDDALLVKVGKSMNMMSAGQVDGFIRGRLAG